jgi:hypothetical protein
MIHESIENIRSAPIEQRIQAIEFILESLKKDMLAVTPKAQAPKRFKIRKFSLGEEVHVDREQIYSDRNI